MRYLGTSLWSKSNPIKSGKSNLVNNSQTELLETEGWRQWKCGSVGRRSGWVPTIFRVCWWWVVRWHRGGDGGSVVVFGCFVNLWCVTPTIRDHMCL
ncbi:hypothetical protein HanRHA438_Chr17g0800431 [Helianthus annuus]|nr:hypothetical protein HanRHA438_Chr17g0800431 [Helianthus annuus]